MNKILIVLLLFFTLNNASTVDANSVMVIFFYSETCPHCQGEISFLEQLELEYPDVEILKFNTKLENNTRLWRKLAQAYEINSLELPLTIVGTTAIVGYDNDETSGKTIETLVVDCLEKGCTNSIEKVDTSTSEEEISLFKLVGLAIVDAINPCEIAILVFLLTTMLTRFPKDKIKAVKSGFALAGGIGFMYFFFGVMIIIGFKFFTNISNINQVWIYKVLGFFSIILGLLNVKDALWFGAGGFVLGVPMSWRPRLKMIIQSTSSVRASFVLGLVVSFFLTPCTAGPYLIASGILSEINILKAIPFLILYLVIFVSPLIIITLFIYYGFKTVEDVYGWRENNIKKLHFIAGIILLFLGISMIYGLI